jgi:hypothetical protein
VRIGLDGSLAGLGVVGFYDRPRSGRPTLFNAEEQQKVYEYLDDSPKDGK